MSDQFFRRAVCGAIAAVVFGGCVGGGSNNPRGDNETAGATDPDNSDSEEQTATGVERLPEPSPLAGPLEELVSATDRAAVIEEHGLTVRDGAVRVNISLTDDGETPEKYLPEERTEYGDTIVAFVDIDSLVDLALVEGVRLVAPKFEPETQN